MNLLSIVYFANKCTLHMTTYFASNKFDGKVNYQSCQYFARYNKVVKKKKIIQYLSYSRSKYADRIHFLREFLTPYI